MKAGMTLQQLAQQLQDQATRKRDLIADARALRFHVDDEAVALAIDGDAGGEAFAVRETANRQFASFLGVPMTYYRRMMTAAPDLLATNLNHWLERSTDRDGGPVRRMVRTMNAPTDQPQARPYVRALLSSGYRPLDNYDLAKAILPTIGELEAEILSANVSDDYLHLKFASPKTEGWVKELDRGGHHGLNPGDRDLIRAGGAIRNSEVGLGTLAISELDYRLVCSNGMIREAVVRKTHIGSKFDGEGTSFEVDYSDETRAASDRSFFLKARDATKALFDDGRFAARLNHYRDAADARIATTPVAAVRVVGRRLDLTDEEQDSVLGHLIEGGDLTQWGLSNALTRASQDVDDYDRATDLEAMGGRVVDLPAKDWNTIANATTKTR